MKVLHLGDARLRAKMRACVAAQDALDTAARSLLRGQRVPVELAKLLERIEDAVTELRWAAIDAADQHLIDAALLVLAAHARWARAKLGSDSEREAAAAYLKAMDELRRFA